MFGFEFKQLLNVGDAFPTFIPAFSNNQTLLSTWEDSPHKYADSPPVTIPQGHVNGIPGFLPLR